VSAAGPLPPDVPATTAPTPPHDVPSAMDLLAAVREFLEGDVVPATEGRVKFHARVAANVLAMVVRELALGPAQAAAHAEGLSRLGVDDDSALARAIRSGALDDRLDEVTALVRADVVDKLRVANPGYMDGNGDPGGSGTGRR
jgi:hypothetical protein